MIISVNIGYKSSMGQGILSTFPIVWPFKNIREFTEFIRPQCLNLINWTTPNHVPKSSLVLHINIVTLYDEDGNEDPSGEWQDSREFTIHFKNVREYKPYMNMSDQEIEALNRDQKISNILDGEK